MWLVPLMLSLSLTFGNPFCLLERQDKQNRVYMEVGMGEVAGSFFIITQSTSDILHLKSYEFP